jgi:hypothetical protein
LSPVEAERIALAWAEREARQVSKKHPQNGPSLNKAPYKKEKPLTDAGLAAINKRKADADAEFLAKARSGRIFSQAMRDNGNCLPIVGPGAKKFWDKLEKAKGCKLCKGKGYVESEFWADRIRYVVPGTRKACPNGCKER